MAGLDSKWLLPLLATAAAPLLAAVAAANLFRSNPSPAAHSYVPVPVHDNDDDETERDAAPSAAAISPATSGRVLAVDVISISLNTAQLVLAIGFLFFAVVHNGHGPLVALSLLAAVASWVITLRLSISTARSYPAPPAPATSKFTFWVYLPALLNELGIVHLLLSSEHPLPIVGYVVPAISALLLILEVYQQYRMDSYGEEAGVAGAVRKPWREVGASIMSQICFNWINQVITLGAQRPLEAKDLLDLAEPDTAAHIVALHYKRK
ncbi:hypothetical protein BDK51DRAFT_39814 [Blyttiomyces helicus]|uniref:Uncharacterized protein n=1 Tax=Blyttiomyces helicus TaxID=388810 RepID=A0A4P9W7N4_9FUNG|nr:hypothetical protein BDK51DRAFT_39814 [Blyttiomyces helicus]|eukprot:RKO86166.1 hypothetical protein BDK51DRAFT_39814 [Blyttiomyces helicus]